MTVGYDVCRLDEQSEPFHGIIKSRRAHRHHLLVLVSCSLPTVAVDRHRIVNHRHRPALKQRAAAATVGKPSADSHKMDVGIVVYAFFPLPHTVRQVVAIRETHKPAMSALALIAVATIGMVADSRHAPHIVQRPHQPLSHCGKSPDVGERQHPLVYPIETHHIG